MRMDELSLTDWESITYLLIFVDVADTPLFTPDDQVSDTEVPLLLLADYEPLKPFGSAQWCASFVSHEEETTLFDAVRTRQLAPQPFRFVILRRELDPAPIGDDPWERWTDAQQEEFGKHPVARQLAHFQWYQNETSSALYRLEWAGIRRVERQGEFLVVQWN